MESSKTWGWKIVTVTSCGWSGSIDLTNSKYADMINVFWIVTVVSSYHGEAIRSLWGPVTCRKRWNWDLSLWGEDESVVLKFELKLGDVSKRLFSWGGAIVVCFLERVQTGRARRLTMCWWLQLKKRLVFQTANFFPAWDWNATPLIPGRDFLPIR